MPTALLGESFSALGSDGDPARPQRLGEVEMADGDVHGIAVHIAARIIALAGPGEVLVSGVIPPLVLGPELRSPTAAVTNSRVCPTVGLSSRYATPAADGPRPRQAT
jgi:hypothetical protein